MGGGTQKEKENWLAGVISMVGVEKAVVIWVWALYPPIHDDVAIQDVIINFQILGHLFFFLTPYLKDFSERASKRAN